MAFLTLFMTLVCNLSSSSSIYRISPYGPAVSERSYLYPTGASGSKDVMVSSKSATTGENRDAVEAGEVICDSRRTIGTC